MENISNFYIELSINPEKMAAFNSGNDQQALINNRKEMLKAANITGNNDIIYMDQQQLNDFLSEELARTCDDWKNINLLKSNTDNNASCLGNRRTH
ncbi:hypothetical protein [Aliikangiella sp. IMCC44359]|uniref:hypothetical protein n=1 Tax=Aliikangiella sp. IMCC44359 TaxID=3459125 RepID=UPI00403AA49B